VKILLDCSPAKIAEYSEQYAYEFWQLRTPLTRNAIAGVPWALDNGCFTKFDHKTWIRMVREGVRHSTNKHEQDRCLWATMPDIVGDAMRTLELFDHFTNETYGIRRALVLQDGIHNHRIPWNRVDAVFVGGSDVFKTLPSTINACKAAKMLGKWVHVGRVNTAKRVRDFVGIADSIDGSGLSRFDHMLEDVLDAIRGKSPQGQLLTSSRDT
jgi:hypothetical protein